jgi:hypothetical protein
MPQEPLLENEENDSDNDSIATQDIIEEQVPEPEQPETVQSPEPSPAPQKSRRVKKIKAVKVPTHAPCSDETPEQEVTPKPEPKKRGRPKGSKTKDDKSDIIGYTKEELVEMVKTQHELLKTHEMIAVEKREFLKNKLENKPKVKRERTQAQKDATARMMEANRLRRQAKLDSIAKDVKADLEKSVSDLVQDEIVRVIQAPLRTLTPERQRKVKQVEEVAMSKYKSSF